MQKCRCLVCWPKESGNTLCDVLCCAVVVLSVCHSVGSWLLSRETLFSRLFCSVVKEQQILADCHLNSKVQ